MQYTINLGPAEAAAVADAAKQALMSERDFLEHWVQTTIAANIAAKAEAERTTPSATAQMVLRALALAKAKKSKPVQPNDLITAWGKVEPNSDLKILKDGIDDLVEKGFVTFDAPNNRTTLTKEGAKILPHYA